MKYTADTIIIDVLDNHKNGEIILAGIGMHCLHCPCAQQETLGEACKAHSYDIELLLQKLNEKN